jgi:hypothetical protein
LESKKSGFLLDVRVKTIFVAAAHPKSPALGYNYPTKRTKAIVARFSSTKKR